MPNLPTRISREAAQRRDERAFDKGEVPEENVLDLRALVEKRKAAASPSQGHAAHAGTFAKPGPSTERDRPRTPRKPFFTAARLRSAGRFSVLGVLIALPVFGLGAYQNVQEARGVVLGASVEAYDALQSGTAAATAFDFRAAQELFTAAEDAVGRAQAAVEQTSPVVRGVVSVVPVLGSRLRSGEHLLAAAKLLAESGTLVSQALAPLAETEVSLGEDTGKATRLSDLVGSLAGTLDVLREKLRLTEEHLQAVDLAAVPEANREELRALRDRLPAVRAELDRLEQFATLLSGIASGSEVRDYLLLFQNNREMRATGGFIGSLALVEARAGAFRVLEVPGRGPYEINDDFTMNIIPPQPLWLINNQWQLQDANWWPDWPTSAAKVAWFYEQARGFPIHGVISMTPTLVEHLLRETGPVDFTEKYGLVLTSENFITETQREVESDFDREVNRPKAIIADLLPILLDRLLTVEPERLVSSLSVLSTGLAEKHLLLYFRDPALQSIVEDMGWAGRMTEAPLDYLSVIHTNISGGKTDGAIEEVLEYRVEADADGSLVASLRIIRTHHGDPNNPQENIRNLDYVRVYAPAGSEFLEATGFTTIDRSRLLFPTEGATVDQDLQTTEGKPLIDERTGTRISEEFSKTVFANWIQTELGKTQSATFRYRLPFRPQNDEFRYSLLWQKQPGHPGQTARVVFPAPEGWEITEKAPEASMVTREGLTFFETKLSTDRAFGLVFRR